MNVMKYVYRPEDKQETFADRSSFELAVVDSPVGISPEI